MRFNEFSNGLQNYTATVRVVGNHGSSVVKTAIDAESQQQARVLLVHLYGEGNVLNITHKMTEDGSKVLSPQEQQVKSMSDQAKRLQDQAKQMKARNKLHRAQSAVNKASLTN